MILNASSKMNKKPTALRAELSTSNKLSMTKTPNAMAIERE